MTSSAQTSLAAKCLVDDLPGASQAGARLHSIMVKLKAAEPISEIATTLNHCNAPLRRGFD